VKKGFLILLGALLLMIPASAWGWSAEVAVSVQCEGESNVVSASIVSSDEAGAHIISVAPTSFPGTAGSGTVTVVVGWEGTEETQTTEHAVQFGDCVVAPTPQPVPPPPPVPSQPVCPDGGPNNVGTDGKDEGTPGQNDSCWRGSAAPAPVVQAAPAPAPAAAAAPAATPAPAPAPVAVVEAPAVKKTLAVKPKPAEGASSTKVVEKAPAKPKAAPARATKSETLPYTGAPVALYGLGGLLLIGLGIMTLRRVES
jgi:hypothetical protein